MRSAETLGRFAPFFQNLQVPPYFGLDGMLNAHGLTTDGRDYIGRLMRHGMSVGLEHMGHQTVDDVYSVVSDTLKGTGPWRMRAVRQGAGAGVLLRSRVPTRRVTCPLRRLSVQDRSRTTVEGFRPSEYEVSDRQAELVGRTRGVVGQFTGEDPVIAPDGFAIPAELHNDCAGSSKSFATSVLYALHHLRGRGVGLATDFTIISGTAPRFGKYSCWAYRAAANPDDEQARMSEQYQHNAQRDGVVYDFYNGRPPKNVVVGNNQPLTAYRMGVRRAPFDINVDGFAHYGLLPDLLQDAKNVGLPRTAFRGRFRRRVSRLFRSDKRQLAPREMPRLAMSSWLGTIGTEPSPSWIRRRRSDASQKSTWFLIAQTASPRSSGA